MELKTFLAELVTGLSSLDFVESIDLRTEAFTLKGRVPLKKRGFLEIYFNEETQTTAVAWIAEGRRLWGIDRDNIRDWHRHPLEKPESHQRISPVTTKEIILELERVWNQDSEAESCGEE